MHVSQAQSFDVQLLLIAAAIPHITFLAGYSNARQELDTLKITNAMGNRQLQ